MIELNNIYNENCINTMARMPDGFVDLTVTSPPYDDLRSYHGYSFEFEKIAAELFRVTKPGGVVVWIVGDQTINGSESGTSFRQALFFMGLGFNLHDTMIFQKDGTPKNSNNRYTDNFEYMFIFSKGKPKTANIIKDQPNKDFREKGKSTTIRDKAGNLKKERWTYNRFVPRKNIWKYNVGMNKSSKDKISFQHPATFPEKLAADHILSWSNENDIVYDPFIGSGTTAKMAIIGKRNYIGSEISETYCKIAEIRLQQINIFSAEAPANV